MAKSYDRLLASLQALGLSLYEAKLYLGLVQNGSQNGNSLSRAAGVPSSKVYSTLDKMSSTGIVKYVEGHTGAEYVAIPPADLVRRLRDRYEQPLDVLEAELPGFAEEVPEPEIITSSNAKALEEVSRRIIDEASDEVIVSLWEDSLLPLREALERADARGVRVFGMIYGETELEFGFTLHHSFRETVAARIGGHMLTLVADGSAALIMYMPDAGAPLGIETRNPVLCLIAEEYLRHELLLQTAQTMRGPKELVDEWLKRDSAERELILGRGSRESPR